MCKALAILSVVLSLVGVAAAAPVNCQTLRPSLDALINDPTYADGCFVQDKLFTNFEYVQGGVANPAAAQVRTTFGLTLGPNPPEGDLHEIRFTSIGTSWTLPFTISYDMGLYNAPLGTIIIQAFIDLNVPGGDTLPTAAQTMVGVNGAYLVSATVSSPGSVNLDDEAGLSVLISADPRGQRVTSLVDSFGQATMHANIPEPGTLGLVGLGLILAGTFGRWRITR